MTDDLVQRLREDVFYGDARLANMDKHNPLHMDAADCIEQLEREKAVVSDLWEQQKQIALDYLADCNKAAEHIEAQCRAIEQHEAFKQEVSGVMTYIKALYPTLPTDYDRFIIPAPQPDPLVEVIKEWWNMDIRENDAETLRELLEARGLEIREKEQNK